MSLRLEMLQVARLAPTLLGEEASGLVESFVRSQAHPEGGFADRDRAADLYYTSFAIDCLTALQSPLPEEALARWLSTQGEVADSLDFVHSCCLARCFSALARRPSTSEMGPVFERIESFRTPDGGYHQSEEAETGSTYAAFLAYGAYADHGIAPPGVEGLVVSLEGLRTEEGAWVNEAGFPVPNVPSTAAAVSLCRNLRLPVPAQTGEWILQSFDPASGGFRVFPAAPIPDLLSTAVALHALDGLQVPFGAIREPALDFIDSLWTAAGGFHGNWEDDDLDIEYTYYGLLALGHLAL